jgi:hypothetical protein
MRTGTADMTDATDMTIVTRADIREGYDGWDLPAVPW